MSDELKTFEYEALRRELEATGKRTYDSVFFSITASSAILGYGLTQDNVFVLLTPLLILWGAFQIIRQSMRSQRRISAYLRVFHESKESGAVWESALASSRTSNKSPPPIGRWRNITNRLRLAAQRVPSL